ncbi:MAG: IS1096 element passenger TnpR family protein [Xanthobacteraceae bacterium]
MGRGPDEEAKSRGVLAVRALEPDRVALCPPEDCGGFPGYYDFLDNIASKQSKKRKAALDWYGAPYDPDEIDEQQIVITLNRIAKTWRSGRSKTVKT